MRYAWPAKQCCWLGSSRYPHRCRVAFTNSNSVTNTYTDPNDNSNGYGHCYTNSDSHVYGQCYANSNGYSNHDSHSYTYSYCDVYTKTNA